MYLDAQNRMLQITYAKGPNGDTVDGTSSGKLYYGLYQVYLVSIGLRKPLYFRSFGKVVIEAPIN